MAIKKDFNYLFHYPIEVSHKRLRVWGSSDLMGKERAHEGDLSFNTLAKRPLGLRVWGSSDLMERKLGHWIPAKCFNTLAKRPLGLRVWGSSDCGVEQR